MKAITLRNIPKDLARAIEKKAHAEGKSLNQVVLELLGRAFGVKDRPPAPVNRDFDDLFGSWSKAEADEFDSALRDQRSIDPELWK